MTHKKARREILVVMRTYEINSSTNKNQNTINEWSNMYKVELVCNLNIYEYSKGIDMKLFILLLSIPLCKMISSSIREEEKKVIELERRGGLNRCCVRDGKVIHS